jgi:hypothetical protein
MQANSLVPVTANVRPTSRHQLPGEDRDERRRIAERWAWQAKVGVIPKLVLLALASACDQKAFCDVRQRELARRCSCSVRAVQAAIGRLVRERYLDVEARWSEDGGRSSNAYRLRFQRDLSPEAAADRGCRIGERRDA